MTDVNFCTCTDYECKFHPTNHDQGCTPCIASNLKDGEIPTCFFVKAKGDAKDIKDFSIEGFAAVVSGKEK